MHHLICLPVEAVFCGVVWRLRGGAFTSLTGDNLGTQFARGAAGILIGGPAWVLSGRLVLLPLVAIAIFLGLLLTGWEEFDEMGAETGAIAKINMGYWMRWLPGALGLTVDTVPYDLVGMAQAGVVCLAPTAWVAAWWGGWWPALILLTAGACFGFAYLLARLGWPAVPRFSVGQEWGELFAGALLGAALVLAFG